MSPGELREQVWDLLSSQRVAIYPTPPHGHHPNFVAVARAAARLEQLPVFRESAIVLAGLDHVLRSLRTAALRSGKVLFVPHPDRSGIFIRLEGPSPLSARRVRDLTRYGSLVKAGEFQPDLVLVGSVAVDLQGGRIGKGYGFPPARIWSPAPWATLVHPLQVFETLPAEPENQLQWLATPHRVWPGSFS